jgi:HlyD family secretion protein
MTAQVRLVVGNRQHVLRIPTAALRFRLPDDEAEAAAKQKNGADGKLATNTAGVAPPAADDDVAFRSKNETTRSFKIYKLDAQNRPVPVDIKIGLSNFRYTEVLSGAIGQGDKVIIRALTPGTPSLM